MVDVASRTKTLMIEVEQVNQISETSGTAEAVTGRRKVIDFLGSPLSKAVGKAGGSNEAISFVEARGRPVSELCCEKKAQCYEVKIWMAVVVVYLVRYIVHQRPF